MKKFSKGSWQEAEYEYEQRNTDPESRFEGKPKDPKRTEPIYNRRRKSTRISKPTKTWQAPRYDVRVITFEVNMTLEEQLLRDEGCKLIPYKDTEGIWTVGVGHNLEAAHEPIPASISMDQAMTYLKNDLQRSKDGLFHSLPWVATLDPIRQAVLINMYFNMGARLLQFHHMLSAVQAGNWHVASSEMLTSKWATQVLGRATRLSQQMILGDAIR